MELSSIGVSRRYHDSFPHNCRRVFPSTRVPEKIMKKKKSRKIFRSTQPGVRYPEKQNLKKQRKPQISFIPKHERVVNQIEFWKISPLLHGRKTSKKRFLKIFPISSNGKAFKSVPFRRENQQKWSIITIQSNS